MLRRAQIPDQRGAALRAGRGRFAFEGGELLFGAFDAFGVTATFQEGAIEVYPFFHPLEDFVFLFIGRCFFVGFMRFGATVTDVGDVHLFVGHRTIFGTFVGVRRAGRYLARFRVAGGLTGLHSGAGLGGVERAEPGVCRLCKF